MMVPPYVEHPFSENINIEMTKPIAIASDHAGFRLKQSLKDVIAEEGYETLDLGTESEESVDYPDFANLLAEAFSDGKAELGVLICGSGIGISMAANRHGHIRAALCHNSTAARLCRQHNNANVLALGARLIGEEVALDCVRTFLATDYEGGRHDKRLAKFSD